MTDSKMWFGTKSHMQWVPCPLIESTIARKRHVETIQFENGGGDVRRSNAYQLEYALEFFGEAHEVDGIDVFNRYASGLYGDGYIYLAHPANFETNMFGAAWASPALIESGWKNIYPSMPTFSDTATSLNNQPKRTATFTIDTVPLLVTKSFTIPIPLGHTLYIGASGIAGGTAAIKARPINYDGSYAALESVQLNAPSDTERFGTEISGFAAVEVFLTRTTTETSTLSLTSMIAQLYLTGSGSPSTTSHIFGEGSTGMMFIDDAVVENYTYMYPPLKGISTTLVEVEAWR